MGRVDPASDAPPSTARSVPNLYPARCDPAPQRGDPQRAVVDSYIVRVYRRDRTRQKGLVGIVEKVGAAEKRVFSDRDELWRILMLAPALLDISLLDFFVPGWVRKSAGRIPGDAPQRRAVSY